MISPSASFAKIIDGKALAADLQKRIASAVEALNHDHAITPALAVVLVQTSADGGPNTIDVLRP